MKSRFPRALAALLLALPAFSAAAGVKLATSYSFSQTDFEPATGNQTETDSETTAISASYKLGKSFTIAANYSHGNSDTRGTNNSTTSSSTTDLLGLTMTWRVARPLSLFAGYTYGQIDASSVVTPGSVFFDNEIDLGVAVAGVSLFAPISRRAFAGITGVGAYASTDVDDYLLQVGLGTRPGRKSSTTTLSVVPTIGYRYEKATLSMSYSHGFKNRAGGSEPDRSSGKLKFGAKFKLGREASLGLNFSTAVAKKATETNGVAVKFGYAFK